MSMFESDSSSYDEPESTLDDGMHSRGLEQQLHAGGESMLELAYQFAERQEAQQSDALATEPPAGWVRSNLIIWLLPSFLVVHGLLATQLAVRFAPLSSLCMIAAMLATALACLSCMRHAAGIVRALWLLLSSAIMLKAAALSIAMAAEVAGELQSPVPGLPELLSALYGIPLLLAVSIQSGRAILRITGLVNACLSLAFGFLMYVLIFSRVTLRGTSSTANILFLVAMFDVLALYLALAATVRLFGASNQMERRYYYVLSVFLWANNITQAIRNRILIQHDYIWLDLLVVVPYLLLFFLIASPTPRVVKDFQPSSRTSHLVRSGSSIFLSLALLLLGIMVVRSNFLLGSAATLMSIAGYGLLNTLAHSMEMETSHAALVAAHKLEKLVDIDPLTELSNRRAFDHRLAWEFNAARRSKQPLSLLILDVDYFKLVNDTLGHPLGDKYLAEIARSLKRALPRLTDFIARYGGEEFAVILPATGSVGAGDVAMKLCSAVAKLDLDHPSSPLGKVTISIGCATYDADPQADAEWLLTAADRGLYMAKHCGRNCAATA